MFAAVVGWPVFHVFLLGIVRVASFYHQSVFCPYDFFLTKNPKIFLCATVGTRIFVQEPYLAFREILYTLV